MASLPLGPEKISKKVDCAMFMPSVCDDGVPKQILKFHVFDGSAARPMGSKDSKPRARKLSRHGEGEDLKNFSSAVGVSVGEDVDSVHTHSTCTIFLLCNQDFRRRAWGTVTRLQPCSSIPGITHFGGASMHPDGLHDDTWSMGAIRPCSPANVI